MLVGGCRSALDYFNFLRQEAGASGENGDVGGPRNLRRKCEIVL